MYYSIIPDKNYFLAEANGYLAMDYENLFGILDNAFEEMTEIDITNQLILDDYYTTDLHWRQENLMDVADFLLEGMGQDLKGDYELQKLDVPFYGVYASQSAYDAKADNICYWTNEQLEQYRAYNYETKKTTGVYDMDKAYGKDPYEMFLSGPVSLVHVENANAVSEKNLIVFRDSFGSSVAPLLVEPYAKVTFVDIRYIHPDLLGNYVDFENADVLFLYSTSVLNNGDTFK